MIYIGDVDGKFYAIDAAGGTEKWSVTSGAEINAGGEFLSRQGAVHLARRRVLLP